jgi:hypothetical protein
MKVMKKKYLVALLIMKEISLLLAPRITLVEYGLIMSIRNNELLIKSYKFIIKILNLMKLIIFIKFIIIYNY